MFEDLIKKYYHKKTIGYCYEVSDCLSGWYFQEYIIIDTKNGQKLVPYKNYIVDTYYEKELEIEMYHLNNFKSKEKWENNNKQPQKQIKF